MKFVKQRYVTPIVVNGNHDQQESLANAKINAWQHCVSLTGWTVASVAAIISLWRRRRHRLIIAAGSERYENRHLRRPLSCLTPHISRTPANICITLISLETTFTGLHFRRWQYGSISIQIFVVGSERQACNVIECIMAVKVIQGHWYLHQSKALYQLPISDQ